MPAETYGGDVNTRITSDFEWQLTAPLVRTLHARAWPQRHELERREPTEPGERVTASDGASRSRGLDTLVRTLRKAGDESRELKDAHARAGEIVAPSARRRCAPPQRRARGFDPAGRQARRRGCTAGRAIVPYAGPIHWGWPAAASAATVPQSTPRRRPRREWTEAAYEKDVEAALDKVKGA